MSGSLISFFVAGILSLLLFPFALQVTLWAYNIHGLTSLENCFFFSFKIGHFFCHFLSSKKKNLFALHSLLEQNFLSFFLLLEKRVIKWLNVLLLLPSYFIKQCFLEPKKEIVSHLNSRSNGHDIFLMFFFLFFSKATFVLFFSRVLHNLIVYIFTNCCGRQLARSYSETITGGCVTKRSNGF